jgi:glycine hydroxymethyltransferase
MHSLMFIDPTIGYLIAEEKKRQQEELSLIASENYAPSAIREAVSSELTNKYAEGYPGKRYYAGCNIVDRVELTAISRCKELFGAEHANVQPHAGSQANFAAYTALLKPGDTILAMNLAMGGHLTHGHDVNLSGMLYKIVSYGVHKETELLDFNEIEYLAHRYKPKLIIAGASAYSRTIDFTKFAIIARSVGAYFMADIAHIAGLIAAQLHPSPVAFADVVTSTTHKTLQGPRGGFILARNEYQEAIDRAVMPGMQGGPFMNVIAAKAVCFKRALTPDFVQYQMQVIANAKAMASLFHERGYRIIAGGTDNHMFMVDVRSKQLTGRAAEKLLEQVGIIASRSCIPFDPAKPWLGSGIRFGTPAITARGMKEIEAEEIVYCIDEVFNHPDSNYKHMAIRKRIGELCAKFPVP